MKKVIVPGLVAGLVMLIVSMVVNMISGVLLPGLMQEYQNTAMFRPWSDPLMQAFMAYPFVLGLALAWVWDKVKGLLGSSPLKKATNLALAYLIVATIPGMFATYTSFAVSLTMVLSWTVSGFINAFVAGLVLDKLNG